MLSLVYRVGLRLHGVYLIMVATWGLTKWGELATFRSAVLAADIDLCVEKMLTTPVLASGVTTAKVEVLLKLLASFMVGRSVVAAFAVSFMYSLYRAS